MLLGDCSHKARVRAASHIVQPRLWQSVIVLKINQIFRNNFEAMLHSKSFSSYLFPNTCYCKSCNKKMSRFFVANCFEQIFNQNMEEIKEDQGV